MTTTERSSAALDLWAEQWAIQAAVKADTIEHQTLIAKATRTLDARGQAAVDAIMSLLTSARCATKCRHRRIRHRGPIDRWRGASVEKAFQSLHAARIFLVEVLSDEEVDALVPKAKARMEATLEPDDPRRQLSDQLSKETPGPARRAILQQVMTITYDASDTSHVRVRDFRNILVVSSLLIAVLMSILAFFVQRYPDAMPLCFEPTSTVVVAGPQASPTPGPNAQSPPATGQPSPASTPTPSATATASASPAVVTTTKSICPSGDEEGQQPSGRDVLIVVGLGLLGGSLAAAFAIRNVRGTSTPYGIPLALAFLKVPSGALTAVAAILLLGGNFVPGLSELDTQRQILAYALVFGYAQQLATRLVDNQAQNILNSVPGKDTKARPQEPPASRATDEPG